ncbi:MAG: HD-GYP domain-containing protein [Deltaproteobacteria bacterium]|nr:HD-GYP domain-containing protein [Deltaproteobacteria bacterium]
MDEPKIIDSLRSLHDLSKAINSTLDIGEVVDMVLENTSRLMKAEKVLILCLERDKNILNVHDAYGFAKGEMEIEQFQNIGSFDHCLLHKGKVIRLEEILPPGDYKEYLKTMPFLAEMVFAPMEIKGEAVGLLGVSNKKHEFSQTELEIFCSLASQAAVAMENANLYRRLKDTFLHTAEALAEAVNSRDPYTGGHVRRVVNYSLSLAHALGLPAEEKANLQLAAILHDIGKIGIDDAILRKSGALSDEEESLMRKHPEIGARILSFIKEMQGVIPGVRHHHEKFDGGGYPEGLRGEDIPLYARIIAIADTFDALTTDRPYRKAIDKKNALEKLYKDEGAHFDPFLLKLFSKCMKVKP